MDLLIVEDNEEFRTLAAAWMTRKGHRVTQAGDGRTASDLVSTRQFDVAILDLNLPDTTGLELFETIRAASEEIEVIFLTGEGTVATAVDAMKKGACDYLTKPFPLAELEERCIKASGVGHLRRDRRSSQGLAQRQPPDGILVFESSVMQEINRLIEKVAPTDAPVLIQGETGTGKEVVADHPASQPSLGPTVCDRSPAASSNSSKANFSATRKVSSGDRRIVLAQPEIADEGTLFIDEIGELPLSLQPKLLRVLEDGSLQRVGSSQELPGQRPHHRRHESRSLQRSPGELLGEDLLYRINVLPITMLSVRTSPISSRCFDIFCSRLAGGGTEAHT
ncbi:MAG: response regulator [Planctomycetales bacterium]